MLILLINKLAQRGLALAIPFISKIFSSVLPTQHGVVVVVVKI
jgi:hypothetical protein